MQYLLISFVFWILILSLLFQIGGIDKISDEYKDLNPILAYAFQIFKFSVGVSQNKEMAYWTSGRIKESTFLSVVMVAYSLFLWAMNSFFLVVILLNFLLAVISHSYD